MKTSTLCFLIESELAGCGNGIGKELIAADERIRLFRNDNLGKVSVGVSVQQNSAQRCLQYDVHGIKHLTTLPNRLD